MSIVAVLATACGSESDADRVAEQPASVEASGAASPTQPSTQPTPPPTTEPVASTTPPATVPDTTAAPATVPVGDIVEGWIADPPARVEPVWERQLAGHDGSGRRSAVVAVADDTLIVAGTGEGRAVALDTATGAERWSIDVTGTTPISEYESYGVFPTIDGATVYIVNSTGTVFAVDAATGESIWTTEIGGPVSGFPVVSGGTVVIARSWDGIYDDSVGYGEITPATTMGLFGLDAATGATRWERATDNLGQVSPGPDDHVLITESNDQDLTAGSVSLVEAATGTEVWRVGEINPRTPAVWAEELVVVAAGALLVFDHDGNELWRSDGSVCQCTLQFPAVVDSTVAVAGNVMQVYGLDATTGAVRWRHNIGDTYGLMFPGPPGTIAVAASSNVAWIDLASGTITVGAQAGEVGGVYSVVSTGHGEVVASGDGFVRLYQL